MVIPCKDDLFAYKNGSFVHTWDEFGYDITDLSYYGEIRDNEGNKLAEFTFIKGNEQIIAQLTKEVMEDMPSGTHNYDIKQVSLNGLSQDIIIIGTFSVRDGVTQLP